MLLRKIFKNTFFISSYYALQKILLFVFYIFLARYTGETGVGKYAFALSFVSIFSILADAGLATLLVKDVARDNTKANTYLIHTLILRSILCIAAFTLLIFMAKYLQLTPEKMSLIVIIGLSELICVLTGSFNAVFRAHQSLQYESLLSAARVTFSIVPAVLLMIKGAAIEMIVVPFLFSNIVIFLLSLVIVYTKFVRFQIQWDWGFARRIITEAAPFALNVLAVTLFLKIDKVMLSLMKGDAEVGFYGIAHSLVYGLLAIPYIYSIVMFPVMSKFFQDKDQLRRILETSFKLFLLMGTLIGILATIAAKDIIYLLYGANFDPSVIVLQYLIWICIFLFFRYNYVYMLGAIDKQKIAALILLTMAGINIVLNYLLIPKFSSLGAVWATFCTEIVGLIFGLYFLYKHIPGLSLKIVLTKCGSIFLALIVGSVILLKAGLIGILTISIPVIMLIYIIAIFLVKVFTEEEVFLFNKVFFSKTSDESSASLPELDDPQK